MLFRSLDTHGIHWSEKFWDAYRKAEVNIDKTTYEKAYVYAGEHRLSPIVGPGFTFFQTLTAQVRVQVDYLVSQGYLPIAERPSVISKIASLAWQEASETLSHSDRLLKKLKTRYILALVSNYYGNIETVLREAGLLPYFRHIVDSGIVGVRKPDPEIFRIAIRQLNLPPASILMVGDSFDRDIVPAHQCGCKTVWIRGRSWKEEPGGPEADFIDRKSVV